MTESAHRLPRGIFLPLACGSFMLVVRVLQAGLILLAHLLATSGHNNMPGLADGLAQAPFLLLAFPPGIASFLAARRSSRSGFRVGVLTGAIGGLLLAGGDTAVRIILPGLWVLLSYVAGPPPGPLVSPAVLFAADLGISLFWGLVAGATGSGLAELRLHHREVTDDEVARTGPESSPPSTV